jgi:hypothetical protein
MGGLVDHRRTGGSGLDPGADPVVQETVASPYRSHSNVHFMNPVESLAYIAPETCAAGATPLPSDSRPQVRTASRCCS